MNHNDRPRFAEAMTGMFAAYSAELTEATLSIWWGLLQRYDLREVREAMAEHLRTSKWAPTPADVIHHLEETLPARRRAERIQRIRAIRDKIEPLDREFLLLKSALDLGTLSEADKAAAGPRMHGIAMQVAAYQTELAALNVNDGPRLTGPSAGTVHASALLPQLEDKRVDPTDPT
ncbi:MAG TPA: hypothetical protein VGK41_01375 [Solirubrobacterales bacterium]